MRDILNGKKFTSYSTVVKEFTILFQQRTLCIETF